MNQLMDMEAIVMFFQMALETPRVTGKVIKILQEQVEIREMQRRQLKRAIHTLEARQRKSSS